MVNFDLKLVGVSAVALLGLYSMNRSQYTDPFTPYDDDQTKRPKRPIRRPKNPLRPRRPISAESFEAEEEDGLSIEEMADMSFSAIDRKSGFVADRLNHTPQSWSKLSKTQKMEILFRIKNNEPWLDWMGAESFEAQSSTKEMNKAYKQYKINLEKYVGFGDMWEKIHDESLRLQSQGLIAFDAWNKACKKFKVYDKLTKGVNMEHLREREKRYEPDSYYGGAESFDADHPKHKGKVRTMSGKPPTTRELKKDKDITPEEIAKRLKIEAESIESDWEGKPYTGKINPNDPDLDEQKADRNKDGKLSSWERAVGNQVAKGIREGGYGSESFEGEDSQSCECITPMSRHAGIHPSVCKSCNLVIDAESFEADPSDFEDDDDLDDEFPTDWSIDNIHHELFVERNCGLCDRPYEYSRLSRALVTHYLRESNGNSLTWKSKSNPEGLKRTARNIAGFEIINYGLDALEHYILQEAKETVVSTQVILLLRKALVPSIIIGDVTEFIKLLELDDVEPSDPKFKDDFWEEWESEDYMNIHSEFNSEQHDDHDDLDALIKRLDDLNQFAITFMHDGGYGGELISTDLDSGIETQIIGFIEDSIRLKIIRDVKNDEILGIRINYTDSPKGPVIYLPPADYIASKPHEIEHEHEHEHHHHEEDEEDDFIQKLNENSRR